MAKKKHIDEFRKKRTKEGKGHAGHFFEKRGKNLLGVGLTHADHTDGVKNIPLEKNPEPNPKDKRKSHVRPVLEEIEEEHLSKRLQGWEFTEKDAAMVRELEKRLLAEREAEKKKKAQPQKKKRRGKKKGK